MYWAKVLRKASVLPITFLGSGSGRVGRDCGVREPGGGYSVVGSVRGVAGNVGGCGSVTGGAGSSTGRILIGVAGGSVGGKCGGTRLAHRNLRTHPGTPCFESIPRSIVFRVLLLEVWEYVFGAVSGPQHHCPMVPLVEPHFPSSRRLLAHRAF